MMGDKIKMANEYYGTPTTPTSDYLAHYGVKGMKWGVRKALYKGGSAGAKALAKQYKKDTKYLAKLEKRAASGKKYAKRAALMGAGAAAAGGLAAAGTLGVANAIRGTSNAVYGATNFSRYAMQKFGKGVANIGLKKTGTAIGTAGTAIGKAGVLAAPKMSKAASAVQNWGGDKSIASSIHGALNKSNLSSNARDKLKGMTSITNSGYARLGAAGVGAGLAAGAGYNAYRALTAGRAGERAATFRREMNKAYAGTKYGTGSSKKRRR